MKPVICFGEALIDFLLVNATEQGPLSLPEFRQYPGGAPANAAVAVAKLGGDSRFAGQVGEDPFGHFLADALRTYGVDTRFLTKHPTAKTALAYVFLDEDGDRSFSFHRHETADVVFSQHQVTADWFSDQPILHFCSNTLTTKDIADCTDFIVKQAQTHGCLVSFDVNLRHNLWETGFADIARVNDLVMQSDIIKFSRDEFDFLAEGEPKAYLSQCLNGRAQLVVITDGAETIHYFTKNAQGKITPPTVKAVDTTAGGDGFIGGLLYAVSQLTDINAAFNDTKALETLLHFAATCGGCAVTQPGAFPALPDRDTALGAFEQHGHNAAQLTALLNG